MTNKTMDRKQWPGYVRVVTYGLTIPTPAMENVDPALRVALNRPPGRGTPADFLTAIRMALASDVDLTTELSLAHPDADVREYLRVLEAHLSKHVGE